MAFSGGADFIKKVAMSEDTRHKLTEIASALVISLIFFLFAQTSAYERIELLTLDARFNLRPLIPTNPDVATIDIDDSALTKEGRWQDWTRTSTPESWT